MRIWKFSKSDRCYLFIPYILFYYQLSFELPFLVLFSCRFQPHLLLVAVTFCSIFTFVRDLLSISRSWVVQTFSNFVNIPSLGHNALLATEFSTRLRGLRFSLTTLHLGDPILGTPSIPSHRSSSQFSPKVLHTPYRVLSYIMVADHLASMFL